MSPFRLKIEFAPIEKDFLAKVKELLDGHSVDEDYQRQLEKEVQNFSRQIQDRFATAILA